MMKDTWKPDHFDQQRDDDMEETLRKPRCKLCGSTDVRWRLQTGKWVLFSSQPGVEHTCPIADDFGVIE